MVAIVSGNTLGLELGSLATLRPHGGTFGTAEQGRSGVAAYVNVANGNLVLQSRDEFLAARGLDAQSVRTYNSQGLLDAAGSWSQGFVQPLRLTGVLNAAGSTIARTGRDGSVGLYRFDATRNLYVTTDGDGPDDTLAFIAADQQFEWRDGASGLVQRYEGAGSYRLLASRDASGNALTYQYNAGGQLSAVGSASGDTTFYDYTGANLTQIRVVTAEGATLTRTRYAHDASGRLVEVTVDLTPEDNSIADGRVYRTQYAYDGSSQRIAQLTQSDGTRLDFSYVQVGATEWRVASIANALGETTRFTYSLTPGAAGFATVTDALGLVTRFDLDATGQLVRVTSPIAAGATSTRQFVYNARGDVLSVTDGEGRAISYEYDASGNPVLQRDGGGNTVRRSFDARGRLLTQTVYLQPDADGAGPLQPGEAQTLRHVWDSTDRGLLRFVISAEGEVTEHRYNGFGERTSSITYLGGRYAVAGLAADAVPTEAQLIAWAATQNPAAAQREDSTYDARGQLQTRTTYTRLDASGAGVLGGTQSTETFVRDAFGRLLQTISPTGAATSYAYDGLGRVLAVTDALGRVTATQYDDANRRTTLTQAGGLATTQVHDAAGRLIASIESAAGTTLGETRYRYDAAGRLRMTQDPTGVRQWFFHDDAGRVIAEVDGNGTLTEYSFGRSGLLARTLVRGTAINTAALVDSTGTPISTAALQALRPADSADDVATWNAYDAAGRLVRSAQSVGVGGATAAVTEYRYDGASRLVQTVRYANGVSTANGAVVPGGVTLPTASSADRITRSFHDAQGRLIGSLDAEGYLTAMRYDAAGRLVERLAYATPTPAAQRATGTLAQLTPASSTGDARSLTLYDAQGRVMAEIDAEGYLSEHVYDTRGLRTRTVRYANRVNASVTATASPESALASLRPTANAADRATARTYDALGRLTQETSPDGVATQYRYDAAGRLEATIRAAGSDEARTLLARYDLQGRLVGELSAQGAALLTGGQTQAQVDAIWSQYGSAHSYDAAGRRTATRDALGNRTLYFYDADGALTHTINALGEVQETRYDARGRVIERIGYAGRIATATLPTLQGGLDRTAVAAAVALIANSALDTRTRYTYTREGGVASSTDALGFTDSVSYNAFGEAIASVQALDATRSVTQTYSVDRRGLRVGSSTDAAGINATTSTSYDAFGRATREVDANGNVRESSYDRLGRIVSTRDPLGATTRSSYDAFGRVLTQTDARGHATSYAYNAATRTLTVTTAEGLVTTTTYSRHGQIQQVTDGTGQVTRYRYDLQGQLVRTETPLTATTSAYDAAGRLLETVDSNGVKVAYGWDAAGRVLTRTVDPGGLSLVTSYRYDGLGQRVAVTDANGVTTTLEYDRKGRVLRQTLDATGLNLKTTYSYDAKGNTLSVTAPGGAVTQYVYDALGRRILERVDPAGLNLQRTWSYDKNGNVVGSTDANGQLTRYTYDAADRLVYTVDAVGNVQQVDYDADGRIVKTVTFATPIDLTGLATTPTTAQVAARVNPQPTRDVVEHRVYDRDGRMTATVDGTGAVVRFTYDAAGRVVLRVAHANAIDLTKWTPGTVPVPTGDATRDERLATVYDPLGRSIYTLDGIGAVTFQSYDGNGNVVQRIAYASAIAANTAATQAAISAAVARIANPARDALERNNYDAAGRLTWRADGTGAVTQRLYDKVGNLVREVRYASTVALTATPSSVVARADADRTTSMAYDAAGRKIFQVDAMRGVTEWAYDGGGNILRRTEYATPMAATPALGAAVTTIRAAVIANAAADRTTRYAYDAAGRQALTIDATGAATEARYDGAGRVIARLVYAKVVDAAVLAALPTAPNAPAPSLASLKALLRPDTPTDRLTQYARDAAGRLVYEVDPMGAVQHTRYDGAGRVTSTVRYFLGVPAGTANTPAAIAAAIRPHGSDRTESFSYNAGGQRLTLTDAAGRTESFTYDALGNKLSFTNQAGSVWRYTYDSASRLITETSPVVSLTSASLSGASIVTSTGEASVITQLAYDALGNLTRRTEAAGRAEERTTTYEYDPLGRQVRVVHPTVSVYDSAADAVLTNGASGLATRTERSFTPESRTHYDALGNAVAGRDIAGAVSQKVYDLLGRVLFDINALGNVVGYERNAFGDVTRTTRYGSSAPTLTAPTLTQASQAATRARVEAALAAPTFSHAQDRVTTQTFDRAGRLTETQEAAAYVRIWDTGASTGQSTTAAARTRHSYDAFGQHVQTQVLRSAPDTWSTTTFYFDAAGRETARIDALGHLTWQQWDNLGQLTETREYSTPRTVGSWSLAGYGSVANPTGDDRTVRYGYDVLGRVTTETRVDIALSTFTGSTVSSTAAPTVTSTRGNAVTRYAYDALGNRTQVTDALGAVTTTTYDRLGRVVSVTAPSRPGAVDGSTLTPLTVYRRDAHGIVIVQIEHAENAGAASAQDRTTTSAYDRLGRLVQTRDANGNDTYSSFNERGQLAKTWRAVSDDTGIRSVFETFEYDLGGRLTASSTPASTSALQGTSIVTLTQAQAGLVRVARTYNTFGELTRQTTQGGRDEYFDYDTSGRLWRTNAGDGIDRISLFDLQGNVSAEIRSAGSGRDNLDVKGFANAQAADASVATRRTDWQRDALGRVVQTLGAARQELPGGVSVRRQFVAATVQSATTSARDESGLPVWSGPNQVALAWNDLSYLGSGDIKVRLDYRTPLSATGGTRDESGLVAPIVYSGGTLRSYTSAVLDGGSAAAGTTLSWNETDAQGDGGVGLLTRIVVYKKDVNGAWQVVLDQDEGHGGNEIAVAAPADPKTALTLELRTAGTTGTGGWWRAGLTDFGDTLRFAADALAAGAYEYRVTETPAGQAPRVTATGTVSIATRPLNTIAAPISYGSADGWLTWPSPGAQVEQTLRWRIGGSTGAWTSVVVRTRPDGVLSTADTRGLAPGSYHFELLWSDAATGVPTSHAVGVFDVIPAVAPAWVPPQGLPNITGLRLGQALADRVVIGQDESGAPIWGGGRVVAGLVWNAANAIAVRANGAPLAIENTYQGHDESGGFTGTQATPIHTLGAGTYAIEIVAGSPPTARATATLVIHPPNPGYWRTVYMSVPVREPIIAGYAPVYETRYATRVVTDQVWVAHPPVFLGVNESGLAIYQYGGHWEARSRTETYAYQAHVANRPVYATDESGQLLYSTRYVSQAQQQWVAGATPAPTLSVTTPPYVPGYMSRGTPVRYAVAVTTAPSSAAISTPEGTAATQTASTQAEARWLRPTTFQKLDRWGNVLEITDPRSASWKTTYQYNAFDQLVRQLQPTDAGAAGGPVTEIHYDALGRQIAVRDARGSVNGRRFDAGGNLVQELQADGGVVTHRYDAFGQKLRTTDARGHEVTFAWDKLGHLLTLTKGQVRVYTTVAGNVPMLADTRPLTESWRYDQLGRKISHTNGNNETLRWRYDLRGNLVATIQPLGQTVRAAFDAQGNKSAELDANGQLATWRYDGFGRLSAHRDLGGATFAYAYDNARQLIRQTSSRGQSLSFGYDAAGQLTAITDSALGQITRYSWDLGGRRIRERVTQGARTYQDNHLAYDALGRLRDVADARVHITLAYDSVGNRTRITTRLAYQGTDGEAVSSSDRHFQYDAMNRQTVVDAVDAAGNLGTQGHRITYDQSGNRTSDTFWGNRVSTTTPVIGQDESGANIYASTPTYTAGQGLVTERYGYDALNRLITVVRDGELIDQRLYDGADRLIRSGPDGALAVGFSQALNQNVAAQDAIGLETRIHRYDANGRLLHQRVLDSRNGAKLDVSYDPNERLTIAGQTYAAAGHDAAGNTLGYVVEDHLAGQATQYNLTLARFEGYQASVTSATGSGGRQPGSSTQHYDANGFLIGVSDATNANNNRTFVNDANGIALMVDQGGRLQRQLVVDGEVLGRYGVAATEQDSRGNPSFANLVDLDFGYARITANYPDAAPGLYQVRSGDTLESIAQASYGERSLWWRIAEANGLGSNAELKVGQSLNIPNRVGTVGNNAESFKPYDPSRIKGDTSPHMAQPAQDRGCGGMGKLLMVVVAVVVTVYTAGAMTAGASGFLQTMAAGASAIAGGTATVGAMAVAGAAGSVASQVVGKTTGTIDSFSWRQVGLSAISSAVTAALPGASSIAGVAAKAAAGNAITQGLGIVTGLQRSFDWRGVAASAMGAGVGQAVTPGLSSAFGDSAGGQFASRLATGLVAGTAAAVARGGRVAIQQVAVDAFGNALGASLAERANGAPTAAIMPRVDVDTGDHLLLGRPYQADPAQVQQLAAALGSDSLAPADLGDDLLVAAGDGFTMGRGPVSMEQHGRTVYVTEQGTEPSIDALLARARAELKQLQRMRDEALTAELNRNSVIRETVTPIFQPATVELPAVMSQVAKGVGDVMTGAIAGLADMTIAPIADVAQVGLKALHGMATGDYQPLTPLSSYGDQVVNSGASAWEGMSAVGTNVFNVSPLGMIYHAGMGGYGFATAAMDRDLRAVTREGLGLGLNFAGVAALGSMSHARTTAATSLAVQAEISTLQRIAANNRAPAHWANLRKAYEQARHQIDFAHIEADVTFKANGKAKAQGGHFSTSPQLQRIPGTESVGANGVIYGQVKLLAPDGTFHLKTNNSGFSSMTPDNWSVARAKGEMSQAWISRALNNKNQWTGYSSGVEFRFHEQLGKPMPWRGYPIKP